MRGWNDWINWVVSMKAKETISDRQPLPMWMQPARASLLTDASPLLPPGRRTTG